MVDVLRVLRGIPEDDPVYDLKLELIENCIYGADIQCIAVQISKLRFFISLVCEQKPTADPKQNYGIHSLPNLETKFVAANSLIGLPQSGRDVLDLCTGDIASLKEELFAVRHRHFSAKTFQEKKELRREDKKLRDSIKRTVRHDAQPDRKRLDLLLKEREKVAEPKWVSTRPAAESAEMFSEFAAAAKSDGDSGLTPTRSNVKRWTPRSRGNTRRRASRPPRSIPLPTCLPPGIRMTRTPARAFLIPSGCSMLPTGSTL